MGGNTALQSGRRLQWIKGIILMTPYDPSYYLLHGQGERFRGLIEEGSVLQSDGLQAIYKDVDAHKEAYCFADAFEDVKDRNMCIVVGGGDDIAPGKHMIMPLWNRLKKTIQWLCRSRSLSTAIIACAMSVWHWQNISRNL